ncbi:MAG: isocitrate/isopropylmalate family dehydrogenase, partial [Roseobacter sp.]
MAPSFQIAVFDGDGIGPEIMQPTLDILTKLADHGGYNLELLNCAAGASHYAQTGVSLPESSMDT